MDGSDFRMVLSLSAEVLAREIEIFFFLLKKGESSKTKIEIISTGKKETYEIYNKINKKFCPWSKWSHL